MKSPKPAKNKRQTNHNSGRPGIHYPKKAVHPPRQGEGTGTPKRLIKEQPETPGTHQINTKNSTSAHYRVLKKHTHTRPDQATPGRFKQQEKNLAHPISTAQAAATGSFQVFPQCQCPSRLAASVSLTSRTLHTATRTKQNTRSQAKSD